MTVRHPSHCLTEQEYGDAMFMLCRKEGHVARLPGNTGHVRDERIEERRVRRLREGGMSHQAIANIVGLSRSRVSQILAGE
jgi:hypothetical protein